MPAKSRETLSCRRQSGVGMIEVLIALLIFAVGVLGMISMQMAAKRATYEATQRSIATSLSRDLLERMRSNPTVLDRYVNAESPAPDCSASACDPNDLADYDVADWQQLLAGASEKVTINGAETNSGGLLNPMSCIENDDGAVTVSIVWSGVNEMLDPNEPCGKGESIYAGSSADLSFRRVQTMTSFISEI